jgi:hypothetical protein
MTPANEAPKPYPDPRTLLPWLREYGRGDDRWCWQRRDFAPSLRDLLCDGHGAEFTFAEYGTRGAALSALTGALNRLEQRGGSTPFLPCGLKELPRLVRVRMDYQGGHESVPGTFTLEMARVHGALQKDLGPLSGDLEIYDAAAGAWL